MGLDIIKERNGKQIDYFRFNWIGCSQFEKWCEEKNLPTPFPNWQGTNDGDVIDCSKKADRFEVRCFLDAYERLYPEDATLGVGEAMREMTFRFSGNDSKIPDEKYHELVALAWVWFLRDAMEKKAKILFY